MSRLIAMLCLCAGSMLCVGCDDSTGTPGEINAGVNSEAGSGHGAIDAASPENPE